MIYSTERKNSMATQKLNRREFLKRSNAAALIGSQLPSQISAAEDIPRGNSSNSNNMEKIVGCYTSPNEIVSAPKYIDALQNQLGVNTLLCGAPLKMPEKLLAKNLPGNQRSHTNDDSLLNKAIDEIHNRGMKFWHYHPSNHHYHGEQGRPITAETFDGVSFLDLPPVKYSLEYLNEASICVSKPAVKEFELEYFEFAAEAYDVDAIYVSHYRYANPSMWTNLFGCACSDCRAEAGKLGYDFRSMKESMLSLRRNLQNMNVKTLEYAAESRLTFMDFLTLLGEDNGVADWLFFRAKLLGNQLKRISDSVHSSRGGKSTFIIDTHPASLSLLVGHNWEDFVRGASDAVLPLSWCGWHYMSPVAAWANQLCEWAHGLDESTALKLVINLFGWDGLGIPDTRIADLRIGRSAKQHASSGAAYKSFYDYFNPDLTTGLMKREWSKMAAICNGRIPSCPVIKGSDWPIEVCRNLIEFNEDLGLTGHIFQGTGMFIDRENL